MNKWLCRPWGIGILTVLLVAFDQVTKFLAVTYLKDQPPIVLWENVFELHYLENRGAAFGMLQGQQWFFLLMGIAVFFAALYLFRYMSEDRKFLPVRLVAVCILAGAWGNMIDRLRFSYVVDFFYFKLINFPIFNVADIYVSVATAVLFVLVLFYYKDEDFNRLLEKKAGKRR